MPAHAQSGVTTEPPFADLNLRDRVGPFAHAIIGLLVAAPLLRPGYLLLLDFVYGPSVVVHWRASPRTYGTVSTAPFEAVLWLLRLTGPVAAFLLVFLLVFGAGYAMNRAVGALVPRSGTAARIVCGTLYAVNPFTYTRLVHGHLGLLAGMVVLPLVAIAYVRLVSNPSLRRAAIFGVSVAGLGFASLHLAVMLLLVIPALIVVAGWPGIRLLAFASVIALVLSSWWIVQVAAYPPPSFGTEDLRVFATVPDGITSAGHVAAMYGFWRVGELPLPRDGVWAWPLTFAPIALLIAWGFVRWWKHRPAAATALGLLAVGSVLFAAGTSFPPTRSVFRWLSSSVPGFTLYREPQKWVAALVFAYALLAAPAVQRIVSMTERVDHDSGEATSRRLKLETFLPVLALLAVVLFYGRTMILNTSVLRPVSFPGDWTTVDRTIQREPSRVLVFPWHLYMTFPFTGHRIANPAETFFNAPVVASDSIEIGRIRTQVRNPESKLVERVLFETGGHERLPETMARLCTGWIVLFKTADWASYEWLDGSPGLRRAFDGPTIRLYKVPALRCM